MNQKWKKYRIPVLQFHRYGFSAGKRYLRVESEQIRNRSPADLERDLVLHDRPDTCTDKFSWIDSYRDRQFVHPGPDIIPAALPVSDTDPVISLLVVHVKNYRFQCDTYGIRIIDIHRDIESDLVKGNRFDCDVCHIDFGLFYEWAATGYKSHGCDKTKNNEMVPVHELGYILIVFEVIIFCRSFRTLKRYPGREPGCHFEKNYWYITDVFSAQLIRFGSSLVYKHRSTAHYYFMDRVLRGGNSLSSFFDFNEKKY